MREFLSLIFCFFITMILVGCSAKPIVYKPNIVCENWKQEIQTNADRWKRGASRWFLLGEPSEAEIQNRIFGRNSGMTTSAIQTAPFTCIRSNGDFQLQIVGSDHESVYIYGPNKGTQAISINVSGSTLFITQTQPVQASISEHVIVRVAVRCLKSLTIYGNGTVEGIHIYSDNLHLGSFGNGRVFLAGKYNLTQLSQSGRNCMFLFGVRSRNLSISTFGTGILNISGMVGLRSINHRGSGDINIIGGYSDKLYIDTRGWGKIGICGVVNLCALCAKGGTRVYISEVRGSEGIKFELADQARVGVAGSANTITVNACNMSTFLGRYLCVRGAYVSAHGNSLVNVSAATKAYAFAMNNAAVYFYGPEEAMESYNMQHGIVFKLPGLRSCMWYNYELVGEHYTVGKVKSCKRRIRNMDYAPGEG